MTERLTIPSRDGTLAAWLTLPADATAGAATDGGATAGAATDGGATAGDPRFGVEAEAARPLSHRNGDHGHRNGPDPTTVGHRNGPDPTTVGHRNGRYPTVVLVHGGGATHDMGLAGYERDFSAAGLAVLAFDFRHLGESSGQPRGLMRPEVYLRDVESVLAYVRDDPRLDGGHTALWGTSFGASHVVAAAARHPELAAAVVQCPVFSGREIALRTGPRALLGFGWPIVDDLLRAATGRERRYLRIVGRPGERAFVTKPGAWEGWHSLIGDGSTFDNRVPAASALSMLGYHAAARLPDVRCPLLVCVSDAENLIDPAGVPRAAATAPRAEIRHYPADHFGVYHGELRERLVGDQLAFLTENLVAAAVS